MAMGMVDFAGVREADWVALIYPFRFGTPTFDIGADRLAVRSHGGGHGRVDRHVSRAGRDLRAQNRAVRTSPAGLPPTDWERSSAACSIPFRYTSFSQNVGPGGHHRSRAAASWSPTAGGILIAFGLLPKLGTLVASIPQPVLGGAGLVMFGMVAATGIKILARIDYGRATTC